MTISQLGKAIGIMARAQAAEDWMHADVDAFHAPSECHGLVAKGEARRFRQARKHAEAVAGASFRVIWQEAERRTGICFDRLFRDAVERIYAARYPF